MDTREWAIRHLEKAEKNYKNYPIYSNQKNVERWKEICSALSFVDATNEYAKGHNLEKTHQVGIMEREVIK